MTNGTRSVSNLKIFLKKKKKKKKKKKEHNCDARYHTGRRNVITLFMMLLYKDVVCMGKEYCMAVYCMDVMHGSFCMGRRLRNKKSERVANLSGSKQIVVGCFSTVILGLSMVDRS